MNELLCYKQKKIPNKGHSFGQRLLTQAVQINL